MFEDRRTSNSRRRQRLPVPAGLDRRDNNRRYRSFSAQPWWLRVDYANELVSTTDEVTATANDKPESSKTHYE